MTVTEKYLKMNHCFIELRDAIYEGDVNEMDEEAGIQHDVGIALYVLSKYLSYYKELNGIKMKEKNDLHRSK